MLARSILFQTSVPQFPIHPPTTNRPAAQTHACLPSAMGLFSSATSGSATPRKSPDGGSIAPDRSSREQCYLARDLFFDCLDDKGIIDAIKEDGAARSKCGKEVLEFENACSKTWVCRITPLFASDLF